MSSLFGKPGDRSRDVVWLAGFAWLLVASFGAVLSVATLPLFGLGLLLVVPLAVVPLLVLSGVWGWRSPIAALLGAAYSFVWTIGLVGSSIATGSPNTLVIALIVATPGILALLAARRLRQENINRHAAAKRSRPT